MLEIFSNAGYVYIISDGSNQDLYKIGKTTKLPAERAKQQNSPFAALKVEYFRPFYDHHSAEKNMHRCFSEQRKGQKEVFGVTLALLTAQLDELYRIELAAYNGIEAVIIHTEKSYTMTDKQTQYEGTIQVTNGDNRKANQISVMYHQTAAQKKLSEAIAKKPKDQFSGIISLPTGGGKTFTAVEWLLQHWLADGKRVLWIAHRAELLNQAFHTFHKNCWSNLLNNKKTIDYLLISGEHEHITQLKPKHELVIASVASLQTNLSVLNTKWIEPNQDSEFMLVIDEAHHAVAPTYRKIINELRSRISGLKIVGLTATPYRTEEFKPKKRKKTDEEQKFESVALGKIFTDNILFSVSLQTLIERKILSKPHFIDKFTGINIDLQLSDEQVRKAEQMDILDPQLVKLLSHFDRNNFIVQDYLSNRVYYGKTLLFAINRIHALALFDMFQKEGVNCKYVISGDAESAKINFQKIDEFRKNEYELLINVNILTEGTDLPDVQTVLLTRPTSSSVLMMQMIGRALRGEKAGGTTDANIVAYTDKFNQRIRFVSPEQLFISDNTDFNDDTIETRANVKRLITLAQIEEFNRIARGLLSTDHQLFDLDFMARVPIGSYFLKGESIAHVLVFNHLKESFDNLVRNLPDFVWQSRPEANDFPALVEQAIKEYFDGYEETLGFDDYYIDQLLRYYAQEGNIPKFIPFEDRDSFDIGKEADNLVELDLRPREANDFKNNLWDDHPEHWQLFFGVGNQAVFRREIDNAVNRLLNPVEAAFTLITPQVDFAQRQKKVQKRESIPPSSNDSPYETAATIGHEATAITQTVQTSTEFTESEFADKNIEPEKIILRVEKSLRQKAEKLTVVCMYSRAQFYAKKGDPIFLLKVVYNRSIEEKKPIACPANGFVRPLPNTNDLYSLGEPYGEVTPIDHKIVDPETLFLFAFYYDTYFEASFSLIDQVTTYNDVAHKTPTAAARVAVKDLFGDKSLNGRDFWRYIDPKTKEEKRLGSHQTYAKS